MALILFFAETGGRRGEVASLKLSNLNLEACGAWVKGKTGKRIVDFTTWTASALRDWLAIRPIVNHDSVFVSRCGRPLTGDGIYQVFRRLARAAGVKGKFNPHSVRHLIGQSITDQANLELTRQKLGHTDISTTAKFYAHQDRVRVREATRQLSNLFQNNKL